MNICDNPPIPKTPANMRAINALVRNGYAYYDKGKVIIDWDQLGPDLYQYRFRVLAMRGIGRKSYNILRDWHKQLGYKPAPVSIKQIELAIFQAIPEGALDIDTIRALQRVQTRYLSQLK